MWTFREGAITPYKPAAQIRFDEVKDVTADGRPDLLFHGPFDDVVESACSGFSYRLVGPSFVAHARMDGSFAVDDAEAKAFARIACPAPPKKLVVMDATDPAMMDESATTANVVCARVWGTSQASLRAKIQAGCKSSKARVECDGTPGECVQQATMLDWAGRKPPVSLSR